MYFLLFRIFEQLALSLKNRLALEFLTVFKYFFIIQNFWASSACPEHRACLAIFQTRGGGHLHRPPASYAYVFSVYSLGVIRVIWTSVVCNLD